MKHFLGTVLLCLFAFQATASDLLRTYNVYSYPKRLKTCLAEAQALADRFSSFTKAKVIDQEAREEKNNICHITIHYTSTPPLELVSNYPNSVHNGTYTNLEECNKNLADETELFEQSTGLQAFVAYCHDDRDPTNRLPIFLRMEAFGTPIKFPRINDNPLTMLRISEDMTSFVSKAKERILEQGLAAAQVVYRREGDIFSTLVTRYYSKKRAPFYFKKIGLFLSEETCLRAKHELEPLFLKEAPGTLGTFCGANEATSREVELYLYRLETEAAMVDSRYPKDYERLALCQANRARVLEIYKTELKRPAFATLCESTPDGYGVRVFEVYPQ